MYNRYVPQSDGSYQRNRIQDPRHVMPPQKQEKLQNKPCSPPVCPPPDSDGCSTGALPFLRQLLPKEFDTGDLLIVLLLLLMAGDCEEGKSNALLTLALYFFL